jgi:ATP-dependent Clp protease ATP-binding subunit ClpX
MDTSNILFICGGTFVNIDKIIGKRLGKRTIGFGQESGVRANTDMTTLLPQVTSDDILEFGLIPELVGRLPVISALTPLDSDSLVRVLTEPKNALVKQYQRLFSMENADLNFTDDALQAIARRAQEKDTGARGLRSIIEEVMLDIMFDLPERGPGNRYVITKDVIEGRKPKLSIVEPKNKSA